MLHNHRAGDGGAGGDIETILSELNSAYPKKSLISPDPSEKRTKRNMDNEAPEQVLAPTSSRELQKERPSETKTVVPPRTKRQKIKDKTQLISDSATLQ